MDTIIFNFGTKATLFFKEFKIETIFGMTVLSLACFLTAIFVEFAKSMTKNEDCRSRLLKTAFYAVQVSASYGLMLITMTMNFWLFSATLLGFIFGNFIFNGTASAEDEERRKLTINEMR